MLFPEKNLSCLKRNARKLVALLVLNAPVSDKLIALSNVFQRGDTDPNENNRTHPPYPRPPLHKVRLHNGRFSVPRRPGTFADPHKDTTMFQPRAITSSTQTLPSVNAVPHSPSDISFPVTAPRHDHIRSSLQSPPSLGDDEEGVTSLFTYLQQLDIYHMI
ncbi:hypothetical protein M8J77_012128 [Diaphorina citri]|nr:hypothetical protein M8J77_005852 [Diaphorina citri]KAI5715200.1 hypothetical protein M8J77_012128 [Diaphorina citri]